MKRFISIQEFLDSFKFNERLYSNTLRYLYNADFQNGLYIDKSPINSGTSKLINLLVLYRIAKWVTNGEDTPAAIEFYDEDADLAASSFLCELESSSLFVKAKSNSSMKEYALLDKLHIYYKLEDSIISGTNKNYIEFYSNNKLTISFTNLNRGGYATPGQSIGKGIFLGVIVKEIENSKIDELEKCFTDFTHLKTPNKNTSAKLKKELYSTLLDERLYTHNIDYRLYPEMIHRKPFAIVCCPNLHEYRPIKFDNTNIIEINCPPSIKEYEGKTTVMDSYGQWDEEKKAEDFDVFLHEYKIKFTKPYHCPVESSSISIEDCAVISGPEADKIYEESQTKDSRRDALKKHYGLVEHWDYEFID